MKKQGDPISGRRRRRSSASCWCYVFDLVMDGSLYLGPCDDGQKVAVGEPIVKKMEDKCEWMATSSCLSLPLPSSSRAEGPYNRKNCKKKFSRLLKAVLFGTSLNKKTKKKQLLQKQPESNASQPTTIERDSTPTEENAINPSVQPEISKPDDDETLIGRVVPKPLRPSSNSPSLSPPTPMASDSVELKPEQEGLKERGKGLRGANTGLYMIVASLMFLVLWGRECAILCTAASLFLLPRRNICRNYSSRNEGFDSKRRKRRSLWQRMGIVA